jgi:hypothetical protein
MDEPLLCHPLPPVRASVLVSVSLECSRQALGK